MACSRCLPFSMGCLFLLALSVGIAMVGLVSSSSFDELFQPGWAMDHFIYEGELLKMKLDNYSVAADDNARRCSSSGEKRYWWDEPTMSALNLHQSHQLLWVRANHMIYDYCTDTASVTGTLTGTSKRLNNEQSGAMLTQPKEKLGMVDPETSNEEWRVQSSRGTGFEYLGMVGRVHC
ncbi:hypothetical protein F0562_010958 [Nyssa sinensis]|uniref:Xyloglucan endo-transglycosylase C-terminal domain-containing protein n=1 Tax=Nyssa sinensis TaxID=561372 RepID=A0A5J5A0C5_9ASTE|nr:hypothetical protein F0562_010958 [Nyssa sinensis]